MTATPGPDEYEYLVDRLRHAQQYAEAVRTIAEDALAALRVDDRQEEVVAMTLALNLSERLVRRLQHAEQYAEAARRMAEDALGILEALKREGEDDV